MVEFFPPEQPGLLFPLVTVLHGFYITAGVGGVLVFVLYHDSVCIVVLVSTVLAGLSALPRVHAGEVEQTSHERKPFAPDVRLPGEEVEHWVDTAADEG